VTFIYRFGSALNVHVHSHFIVLEGGSRERAAPGRTPRCLTGQPLPAPDSATVCACGAGDGVPQISQHVMRPLRQRESLEAGLAVAEATGYAPLVHDAPELARPMAAAVPPRLALGERAGQPGRRRGAGCGAAGGRPGAPEGHAGGAKVVCISYTLEFPTLAEHPLVSYNWFGHGAEMLTCACHFYAPTHSARLREPLFTGPLFMAPTPAPTPRHRAPRRIGAPTDHVSVGE